MSKESDRSLPDLGQQRKRAKDLVKAHRKRHPDCAARVAKHLPRASGADAFATKLTLAEAQLVVAREAGFASWPKMVHAVRDATLDGDALTVELREAALAGDAQRADELAARAPLDLMRACLMADVDTVRALDADVTLTVDGWTPLDGLCSVRLRRDDEGDAGRRREIARLLLERGASADSAAPSTDMESGRCSALRGAAARRVDPELVRILLEGGASLDPEAMLDAAQLSPGTDAEEVCLKLLVAQRPKEWVLHHCLARALYADNFAAARVMLEAGGDPNFGGGWGSAGTDLHLSLLREHPLEVFEMLLDAGADTGRRDRDGRTALRAAVRLGRDDVAGLFVERGASEDEVEPVDRVLGAAIAGKAAVAHGELVFTRMDHQLVPWAVRTGRDDAVPRLLALGLDPDVASDDGALALHLAAERGSVSSMRALFTAGARFDRRDRDGLTAVDASLRCLDPEARRRFVSNLKGGFARQVRGIPTGDDELDEILRKAGAVERMDLSRDFQRAVLAVIDGEAELLRELLDLEPELVFARSPLPHRATLLHYVGANGVEDERQRTPPNAPAILRLLLDAGSEVDALCTTYGGGPAQTTLSLLVSSGHPAQAGLQEELVRILCEAGANPDGLDDDGVPMATAIAFRQQQSVRGLADFARLDNALFAAAAGRLDLLETMIAPGGVATSASRHCRVPWLGMSLDPGVVGGQALVCAAKFGELDAVKWLVARGVDPLLRPNDESGPPLHEACFAGHANVVSYLLDAGADPNVKDHRWDSTAIGWALEGGHRDVALLVGERSAPGLIDACDLGLVERVRALLKGDPTLARGDDGKGVPLRVAAYRGHVELVRLLLEHGAEPTAPNPRGQTAIDFAREGGYADVLALLER